MNTNNIVTKRRRLFHYTRAANANKIIASGSIIPSTLYVPKHERPVVWFSSHALFEPTAFPAVAGKGQLSSMEELAQMETPFRFEPLPGKRVVCTGVISVKER